VAAVEVARFGDRGGEHTLIEHTPGCDAAALRRIMWHTDAPPLGGISELGAFVAGYAIEGYYVVQRTVADTGAERAGMVDTVAVLLPNSAVRSVFLDPVFAFLKCAAIGATADAPNLEDLADADAGHRHPDGAAAAVSHLLHGGRVAWTGDGAAAAVACLWRHLAAADRARLTFGAAFRPDALTVPHTDSSLLFMAVPTAYLNTWTGWPVAATTSAPRDDGACAAFLGDDDGGATNVARELAVGGIRFEQWRHVASLARLVPRLDALGHEQLRSTLQLVALVAPAPDVGADLKRRAVARLTQLTPAEPLSDIRGLRAVPWNALPTPDPRSGLVDAWVAAAVGDPARSDDVAEAVADSAGDADDWLHETLAAAVRHHLARDAGALARHLPRLLRDDRGDRLTLWLAAALAKPSLDVAIPEAVAAAGEAPVWLPKVASTAGLPRAHAAAADVSDPVAAWKAHLRVRPRRPAADDLLERRAGASGTVAAALALDDDSLSARAARLAAGDPSLLAPLDLRDDRRRAVWSASIGYGADPWAAIKPRDAAPVLFDLVVAGTDVEPAALEALARTSAADASTHRDRKALWDKLPDTARPEILAATAHALGRRLRSGEAVETPLTAAILHHEVLGEIARDDPAQAVRLLGDLPGAGPEHAVVAAKRGTFSHKVACALGDIVAARRWKGAAESICDLAASRPDLGPAADRVLGVFSIMERIRRAAGYRSALGGLATGDELRDALHGVAARLYPEGPREAWERAGGDPADLPQAQTARQAWSLALRAIHNGVAGAPALADLLHTMETDFPRNADLAAVVAATLEQ